MANFRSTLNMAPASDRISGERSATAPDAEDFGQRPTSSLYTCPAIILAGAWQLTKTTISSALWVVSGRWPISDAPWTRPQQATAFLENAAPQLRTPRTLANDHLRTSSSLYTCPAIISAGAWQLTKTAISSAVIVEPSRSFLSAFLGPGEVAAVCGLLLHS